MKALLFISTLTLISSIGQTRVRDFNNLIKENIKAQNELHKEVKENADVVKAEVPTEKIVIVESEASTFNAPSKDLRFRKETFQYKASEKKQRNRIATEVKEAQQAF